MHPLDAPDRPQRRPGSLTAGACIMQIIKIRYMFSSPFSVFTMNLSVLPSSISMFTLFFSLFSVSERKFVSLVILMVLPSSFLLIFAAFIHSTLKFCIRNSISLSLSFPGTFSQLNKYKISKKQQFTIPSQFRKKSNIKGAVK